MCGVGDRRGINSLLGSRAEYSLLGMDGPQRIGGEMSHSHPDRRHVMTSYRQYIIGEKRKAGGRDPRAFRRGARSLLHYRDYVDEYLEAKRDVFACEAHADERASHKREVSGSNPEAGTKVV